MSTQETCGLMINGISKSEISNGCLINSLQYQDGRMDTLSYIINKYNIPDRAKEYRLSNMLREDLIVLFKELGFLEGCEVGVFRGAFSKYMLDTIPNLKLHCVDCWQPVGRRTERRQRRYLAQARSALRPYRRSGQAHLIRKWSMDAVRGFEDESLDYVYIDGNHNFDYVMQDIIEWSKKVRKGGIVSGHDFHKDKGKVILAVRTYVEAHRINPWFVLDDEVPGRKSKNSWFWVK